MLFSISNLNEFYINDTMYMLYVLQIGMNKGAEKLAFSIVSRYLDKNLLRSASKGPTNVNQWFSKQRDILINRIG